ncbi:MAG TPA: GPO family capsid scaffolding protein, partial [Trinickia sp.]|nr:GPO family capsid scaffolding protein [Trinickia sp.]
KYGARVNLEHIRGVLPDGPFNAYGDVLALEARDETGEFAGKLGLYAQIAPTPALVAMTKAKQKIYTSMEVDPSFADSKQAYLVGLAVTDSPASLGTDVLSFAAGAGEKNPFIARKQSPQNLFSEAIETAIEFDAAAPTSASAASVFAKVVEILGVVKNKSSKDDTRFADLTQAVETLATHGREQAERVAAFATQVEALDAALQTEKAARVAADQAFADLTAKLAQEPGQPQRPTATGANGVVITDC